MRNTATYDSYQLFHLLILEQDQKAKITVVYTKRENIKTVLTFEVVTRVGVHLVFICNFLKKEILFEIFTNIYFYETSPKAASD